MICIVLALAFLPPSSAADPGAIPARCSLQDEHSTRKLRIEDMEAQKGFQWCWAACIKSALGYYELRVPQERVVMATYGTLVDRPLSSPQMALNLLKAGTLSRDRVVHPFYTRGVPPPAALVHEIAVEKAPVIALYRSGPNSNHFVVCYGVTYSGPKEAPLVTKVHVLDPADGKRKDWPAARLASLWVDSVWLRVAPPPTPNFVFNGVPYAVTPTFDVANGLGRVEGRIWYSNQKKGWELFDLAGRSKGLVR